MSRNNRRWNHPSREHQKDRRGGDKPKDDRPGREGKEKPWSMELPSYEWCVMCGQEYGTALRKDGKYYCSRCWQVWNS